MSTRVDDDGRLVPAYSLYPLSAVAGATFLGSPIAGAIVMAVNSGRLGRISERRNVLLWTVLGTATLIAVLFSMPDTLPVPSSVFHLAQVAVMYAIAKHLQGEAIDAHRESGGAVASIWGAAGIGLLCGLLMVGMIFGVLYVAVPGAFTPAVKFNTNDEVYYTGEATREDATLVGVVLTREDFFGDPPGGSVQVSASSGLYTVSFVVMEGAWDNPDALDAARSLGSVLADTRLGRPLMVELCDEEFKSHRSLRID